MEKDELKKVYRHIGSIIKLHREKLGKSQFSLGLEVGKSANQIGRIERAESNPTVETLFHIAKYLKIDIKDFFE